MAVAESRWAESLIFAAQEQTFRTNAIKNPIDKQNVSPLYRLCKEKVKSVAHIVSSCFFPRWKPIQEETQRTWKKSTLAPVQEIWDWMRRQMFLTSTRVTAGEWQM